MAKAFVTIELGLEEDDIKESKTDGSQMRPTIQALRCATKHSTKYKQGGINSRPSTSRTRGIYRQAVKPEMEVDIPGVYCNKNGKEQFAVKLHLGTVIHAISPTKGLSSHPSGILLRSFTHVIYSRRAFGPIHIPLQRPLQPN